MNIRDQWDRLDPDTRKWLTNNPGSVILPRTITATICQECGEDIQCDEHGQMMLSQEDRDFIHSKTDGTPAGTSEHRFFPADQS